MHRKLRFIFEVKKRVRCSKQFLLIISNLLNLICVEICLGVEQHSIYQFALLTKTLPVDFQFRLPPSTSLDFRHARSRRLMMIASTLCAGNGADLVNVAFK